MNSSVQIIDENKNFKVEELSRFLKKSNGSNSIPVVAVFGSQSSGKSTLLNYLFDTKFDVMSGDKRKQTTHGIWLAVEPLESAVILDVEGSDGRERGEDKDFERKAALFSLAIADVLIINIWENSIGLYNASNINLLKTVMEVYFEIYSNLSNSKTTILFVIRDYVGVTPKPALEAIIKEEVFKIWSSTEKPELLEKSNFEDVFDLKFSFLPHKIFKADEFLSAVDTLRDKFFSKNEDECIYDRNSTKRILLQDFPVYLPSIWDIINTNKSLDLPTQQELLAQHRCDETINEICVALSNEIDQLKQTVEKDELGNVVEKLKLLVEKAEKEYFTKLHRYPRNVVQFKHDSLNRRIKELNEHLIHMYCKKIEKKAFKIFEHDLKNSSQPFSEDSLSDSKQRSITFYRASLQEFFKLPGGENLDEKFEAFKAELDEISKRRLNEFFSKTANSICKKFKNSTRSIIPDAFGSYSIKFWSKIEENYVAQIAEALDSFDKTCGSFSESEQLAIAKNQLESDLISIYRENLQIEMSKATLNLRFSKVLDKLFRFDENGRPRHWENLIMIDEAYDNAINKTEALIEAISVYTPSETFLSAFPNFDAELIILPEDSKKDLKDIIKRDAEVMFLEAKRSLVSGSGSIPIWVIILLIVLGWNEFIAIISSPIYLFIALTLMSALFIIHHLHLSGPLMTVLQTAINFLNSPINYSQETENKAKDD